MPVVFNSKSSKVESEITGKVKFSVNYVLCLISVISSVLCVGVADVLGKDWGTEGNTTEQETNKKHKNNNKKNKFL